MKNLLKTAITLGVAGVALSAVTRAQAQANTNTLVISQVYGGGGSTSASATFKNDYIELFNNSNNTLDLSAYSLQYNSATGANAYTASALTGMVAPHDYFLVKEGTAGTGGSDLPVAANGNQFNGVGTLNLSATVGKVALVFGTTPLPASFSTMTGSIPASSYFDPTSNPSGPIIDFVGYGTANQFETTATPALTNAMADIRMSTTTNNVTTFSDTNNNSMDFTQGTPTPHAGNFVYIAPVPEPGSLATMLIGFGALGILVARRRRVGLSPSPTEI